MRRIDEQYLKTPFYGSRKMAKQLGISRYAGAASDAADGLGSDLSQAASVARRRRAPDLPVFAAKCGDRAAQPGVVERHHLRADAARLDVPDGGHGLVQPLRAVVAIVEHARRAVLPGGVGGSVGRAARRRFSTPTRASQYTAQAFTDRLESAGVAISMDGRGRWMDNVFVERLWRTVKYECVYLHDYATPRALEAGLAGYFPFYNDERIARGLGLPHADSSVQGGLTRRQTNSSRWSKSTRNLRNTGENQHIPIVRGRFSGRARPGKGLAGRYSPPSKNP